MGKADMVLGGTDEPVPAEQRDDVRVIRSAVGARAKIEVYAAGTTDEACRSVWEGRSPDRHKDHTAPQSRHWYSG
jgi:hypothetical protein